MPNTTTAFAEMTPAQREKAGTKKEIADQYEELLAAQSPILSKLDLRKQKADFTTVGLINFAKPGTRRDGSIISPNLFVLINEFCQSHACGSYSWGRYFRCW